MSEYEKQARYFLEKTGSTLTVEFLKHDKYFIDDKETRDIYSVILKRGEREYKFTFGQSIANSGFKVLNSNGRELKHIYLKEWDYNERDPQKFKKFLVAHLGSIRGLKIVQPEEPSAYDILACLQTYDVGTFQNFCDEFGYNDDSIKAHDLYKRVVDEHNNLKMLYSDVELKVLGEIL